MENFDYRGSRLDLVLMRSYCQLHSRCSLKHRAQVTCHEKTMSSNEGNSLGTMGVPQDLAHYNHPLNLGLELSFLGEADGVTEVKGP